LDGLPLAIELAVARTRLLSPQALLDRLRKRLTVWGTDLPTRPTGYGHGLRGAIQWSYDLLDPSEQAWFRLLGVFKGRCTPPLVEASASRWSALTLSEPLPGDILPALGSHVDQSLLVRHGRPGVEVRLFRLDSLRKFAMGELVVHGDGLAPR